MKRSLFYSVLCLLSIALLPACGCRKGCVSIMNDCLDKMECCDDRSTCNPCNTCDPCDQIDADADIAECEPETKKAKELADVATINQL